MPTAVAVNDVLRAVVVTKWDAQQQLGLNVHYFIVDAIAGAPTTDNQVDPLDTLIRTAYVNLLSTASKYQGTTLQRYMTPLPLPKPSPSTAAATTGGVAGDPLPGNITGIITWTTDKAGQRYRGRSYIPFPSESDNGSDGLPIANYVTRLNGLASILNTAINTSDGAGNHLTLRKIIYHNRAPGGAWDYVTGSKQRKLWAQQHRRGDYGRVNVTGPFA